MEQSGRKIKVGVIGCGGIFACAHGPALQKAKHLCEVVAVAESDAGRQSTITGLLGDVKIFKDYHDLLARTDIEAVDILLPHDLHMPATIEAAKAGKHVLVEKVMARNVYECDQMIEACQKAGVSLTVCHDRRYDGQWMALKEVVDSGALGEIFYWKLDHNQDVNCRQALSWAASSDRLGGGAVMSCLTHQIDALRWYGGEVESVTAMSKVLSDRMEGETLAVLAATLKSGALANLAINWFTRSGGGNNALWYEMVQACGRLGEAYYMSGKGAFVRLHDSASPGVQRYGKEALNGFVPVPAGPWGGHQKCVEEWVKSLLGMESKVLTSGRDVRGTVEIAEAAYQSINSGKTVHLPIKSHPWGKG